VTEGRRNTTQEKSNESDSIDSFRLIHWRHDRQLGIAFLVAPFVWLSLYLIDRPALSFNWEILISQQFLTLAVMMPILEEIVFRGLVQGWCMNQRWGGNKVFWITHANILTSIVFTAFHFISHTPLMALLVLIPSIVFGYFRDRYHGWLIPSIMLHCFYNAGYFLLYNPSL